MRIRLVGRIAVLAAFSLSTAAAAAKCQLQQVGVLPVDMQGLSPIVSTKINGARARFVLDSGSFYSMMSRDAAAQHQLPVTPAPGRAFYVTGVGGRERAQIATAASFDFLGVPLHNVRFAVVDHDWGEVAGLLGQNLLRISDVEYDLANGIVRFIRPLGCGDQPLAYWAVSTPYSSVDLKYMDIAHPHLISTAMIDGHRVTVMFDTGASHSLLSLEAAGRAGITISSPGVLPGGMVAGIGPGSIRVWVAPIANFQVGGEKVENAHLLIGNAGSNLPLGYAGDRPPELVLGEDFFLSHRIYVAYSQNRLYFTYNGGPLFNLNIPQTAPGTGKSPATPNPTSQATAASDEQGRSDSPTSADGFRRRGMALASMREFTQALADLTHACALAPRDAESHFDRGKIYAEEGQLKSALDDFNMAITLQPDDIDARLARAELLQSHPEIDPATGGTQVKSDLDSISRLAPVGADVRRTLSALYGKAGDYAAAIGQIDQWLSQHPLKGEQFHGLNDRCRLRATSNRDLQEALDDCNHALNIRVFVSLRNGDLVSTRLSPDNPAVLDSRGLVYIRLGNFKDAIRDYDSALQASPKMPTSLYGRGLAELRLGEKPQGEADLAAAEKLDSGIAKRFAAMGLTP